MAQKAIVGVSGGVDSAVTLLTLLDRGYQVLPYYLKLKDGLSDEDSARLKRLAEVTGQEVTVYDGRELFCRRITSPFLQELSRGLTPNPCVWCNQHVKLKLLFQLADELGAEKVATGHYARIVDVAGAPRLAKARSSKDQSYMLYRIPAEWLPRLIFPLGDNEKERTREQARFWLGQSYGGGDSQDICFLGDETLEGYIKGRLPQDEGDMVTPDGRVLGRHKGLAHYTPGQRKGLGLSGGPWFVVGKDQAANRLILDRQPAASAQLILEDLRLHGPLPHRCAVKTRYRGREVSCRAEQVSGRWVLFLDEPVEGVAPGQSAVLYDGDIVVGGGIIASERGES